MSSNLLTGMGLGGMDIGIVMIVFLVFIIILLILLIVTMTKLNNLKKRYERFMMGRNARSMEEEVKNLFYDIDYLKKETSENSRQIRHIYKRLETVYQKIGLVKYDAFNQMGGKLSFALALLDEKNNGFLMNSVHSSDGSYCYIKEIINGDSAIELSGDEQNALNEALSHNVVSMSKKSAGKTSGNKRDAEYAEPVSDRRPAGKKPEKASDRKVKNGAFDKSDDMYDEDYEGSYDEADDEELYEDETYVSSSYTYDDPDLVEAEKVIASISAKKGGHRVVEEDYGGEGVISYTTGRRNRK